VRLALILFIPTKLHGGANPMILGKIWSPALQKEDC